MENSWWCKMEIGHFQTKKRELYLLNNDKLWTTQNKQ